MKKSERTRVRKELQRLAAEAKEVRWPRFLLFDIAGIKLVGDAAAIIECLEAKLMKTK